MTFTVTAGDVARLLPGAAVPDPAHLALAIIWARGELARRRVTLDALSGDALVAARSAVAARALALKAGLGGAIALHASSRAGPAKIIESLKIPDEIEVKYRAVASASEGLSLTAGQFDALAEEFLSYAVPTVTTARVFPGASR
ncbi:hypothetical protein [Deinococcus sp.]|uniref:hypothetical protein n=1 Tax=Deinococcus sp. TaxID=47478 RepID=UPI002869C608|nr:hypothetical protein [Deinococcus sp.]